MMNTKGRILHVCMIVAGMAWLSITSIAAPITCRFDGVITKIDNAGMPGIGKIGDPVSYIFSFDYDRDAELTTANGDIVYLSGDQYAYADLVSRPFFPRGATLPLDYREFHAFDGKLLQWGESGNLFLVSFKDWTVGAKTTGYEWRFGDLSQPPFMSFMECALTLTHKTEPPINIPEPSRAAMIVVTLFGIGMACIRNSRANRRRSG